MEENNKMELNLTKVLLGQVMVAVGTQQRASQCLPERLTRKFTTYLTFSSSMVSTKHS